MPYFIVKPMAKAKVLRWGNQSFAIADQKYYAVMMGNLIVWNFARENLQ